MFVIALDSNPVSTVSQPGSNLSYYAQQQLQADAAKQAQQKQIEEELKLEKKRREESALLGLDAYNLECTYRILFYDVYFLFFLRYLHYF